MERKRVYTFGNGKAEGKADMRNLLGGKGANLAEMNLIGVPVPPGFTITTEVCIEYYELGKDKVVELLKADVEKAIANIETLMNSKFGDVANPLLVSVRSGARASMPGMMDTILNLGLNDEVAEVSPILPNTMACTLTAVPHSSGIPSILRYRIARSFIQLLNTAQIAPHNCS